MENKELTKAEEQVMQYLWKLKKGVLKDIVDEFPHPGPAYTTIATVIRVLVKKKFIGFKTYGKTNEYFPLISKEKYFQGHLTMVINNFFNGSASNFASYFAESSNLNLRELEELRKMIEEKIKQHKPGKR
jgi:BlaI family transcriptional regulator, penicillinase repressor